MRAKRVAPVIKLALLITGLGVAESHPSQTFQSKTLTELTSQTYKLESSHAESLYHSHDADFKTPSCLYADYH